MFDGSTLRMKEVVQIMGQPNATFVSPDAKIVKSCSLVRRCTTVYSYCFKGAPASNTFVALKEAGVKDVRMYFGSWSEWSKDPVLPIDDTVVSWKAA